MARINLIIVSYFVLFFIYIFCCKDLNAHLRETEEVISTIYDDVGLKKVRNLLEHTFERQEKLTGC